MNARVTGPLKVAVRGFYSPLESACKLKQRVLRVISAVFHISIASTFYAICMCFMKLQHVESFASQWWGDCPDGSRRSQRFTSTNRKDRNDFLAMMKKTTKRDFKGK